MEEKQVTKPRKGRVLRHVPFMREAVSMVYAVADPRTPLWVKGTVVAALAYFGLPFDVVPDFFLGLGFTDDAAAIMLALKAISAQVNEQHKQRAEHWLTRE